MSFIERAKTEGLLFDGSMGTLLMKRGLKPGTPPELWNLEKPEEIRKIHREYIEAGADVIQTNSFGGNRRKLSKHGLSDKVREINFTAAKLARESCEPNTLVAGDIGPTGELLEPYGMLSLSDARDVFAEQASFLAEMGVDFILIETMYDIREALAAIEGVQKTTSLPVVTTMTFEKKPSGYVTVMGNKLTESMQILVEKGAVAVGSNCSIGSREMVGLAKELKSGQETPIIIQPNAGIPENINGEMVYPEDKEIFSDNILRIKQSGVEIIGGCCGTTPEYIKQIKLKLKK